MNKKIIDLYNQYESAGISRRGLLGGVGASAALASLLPLLASSGTAQAQWGPMYGDDEREHRWSRVRTLMSEKGLDVLVIPNTSEMGANHLGYSNWMTNGQFGPIVGALIFPLKGDPVLIGNGEPHPDTPPKWVNNYTDKFSANGQISISNHIISTLYEGEYGKANIGVLGTQANSPGGNEFSNEGLISYAVWSSVLAALPEANFVDITEEFAELMLVKSEAEIAQFEKAALLGEELHKTFLENIKIGMTDQDVRWMVTEFMFQSRARPDVQALFIKPGPISDGDVINTEYGINYQGGYAQVTLCMAMGAVSALTEELAGIAHQSVDHAMKNLKPGVRFGDIMQELEDIVVGQGYWHGFPQIHSLRPMFMVGPVYNLAPPENYPSKTVGADTIIQENMILSLECGARKGTSNPPPEVKVGGTCVVTRRGIRMFNELGQRMKNIPA